MENREIITHPITCGGFRHCVGGTFDKENQDCRECYINDIKRITEIIKLGRSTLNVENVR